jgi:hypothetical protein
VLSDVFEAHELRITIETTNEKNRMNLFMILELVFGIACKSNSEFPFYGRSSDSSIFASVVQPQSNMASSSSRRRISNM